MTTIAVTASMLSAAIVAAAVDEDLLPGRRVLVTVNEAAIPEVMAGVADAPGFESLASRFDAVLDLNEAVAPHLPGSVVAGDSHARAARARLAEMAGGPVSRLVLASLDSEVSMTLARMFPEARIDLVVDRLVAYGPTPRSIPRSVTERVERVVHADLVPGAQPRQLVEFGVETVTVGSPAIRTVIAGLAGSQAPTPGDEALILGERWGDAGVLTGDEEDRLHTRMVDAAADAGHHAIAFRPHPHARPTFPAAIVARAAERSLDFRLMATADPVEVFYARTPPSAVIGCSSTALATASAIFGLPAFSVGTADVARAITTPDDPSRVALALTRATVSSLDDGQHPPLDVPVAAFLDVVVDQMRPDVLRRADAAAHAVVSQCAGADDFLVPPSSGPRAPSRHRPQVTGARRLLGRVGASGAGRRLRSARNVLAALGFSARLRTASSRRRD
ncbi:polysialyltransferase family glycosyltransferase [Demequina muriae]|uniref:Polysialyltransferase family glycosyltransferase n=1 Tax=Demequina muriae TaxID=3051664 RepID=A0ABT8GG88_9MICO|nr:polysialyltransferase family glycosyltransferase [Demequina sp. EGI L300058]MDN4480440.1 polysialyltransferase family glycosyltransferase [Demequina sp. EGI L300058]